jgi:tetratricopeptide (TPR) repeat protein
MGKPGRNDPCLCGSGKKYKNCCLAKDEASQRAERQASNAALNAEVQRSYEEFEELMDRGERSDRVASAIWELIQMKQFVHAEQATHKYIDHFTESPIGYDLMAYICEARGEFLSAAQWLHKVIEFMRDQPEMFSAKDEAPFQKRIARFESSTI